MKELPITSRYGYGLSVLVDDDIYDRMIGKNISLDTWDYPTCNSVPIHRIVMNCTANDGNIVDHIDRNKLNALRNNLRFCNDKQNAWNKGLSKNSKRRFKGVYKFGDKWLAFINTETSRLFVGDFNTDIEAAKAYNMAAIKYHGEFAWLNKIEQDGVPVHEIIMMK